jgi:predicted dehydrogenase
MTTNQYKVAIIGAGFMAEEHIKVFSSMKHVDVVGIYNRSENRANKIRKKYNIPFVAKSINELYESTLADLVLIAVSEMAVHSVVTEAFIYPWHSLIEKPAGYNFENASLILNLAKKFDAKAFVSFNRRFFSSTLSMLSQLKKINQQRLIEVSDQEEPLSLDRPDEVHKNWMYANSIHLIDYLNFVGRGSINKVTPIVSWNPTNPKFVITKIEYSSGDIGIYKALWNAPGPWSVSVSTQEKRFELKPLEQVSVQLRGSRQITLLDQDEWDKKFKPGLRMQAEEILKELNGQSSLLVSLEENLQTMQLVKDIYEL